MTAPIDRRLVEFSGEGELIAILRVPLTSALGDRRRRYVVRVEAIGRAGEVLIVISSSGGQLPLIFRRDKLDPSHVLQMVRDAVARFEI